MEKYKWIVVNSFSNYFAYRLNFFLWRIRVIVSILISYFLWYSVFQTKTTVFGYEKGQMLTYILLISFLNAVVLSTQTFRVAQEIQDGSLSTILLQPVSYFGYNFARDVADKLINTVFSILEISLLLWILKPEVVIQTRIYLLALFLGAVFCAAFMYFCINMLLSCIGFWSRESWAPRFIFFILVTFLAGTYFPLDIFPPAVYFLLRLLPFTYLIYFPLKIYLGQVTAYDVIGGFTIGLTWCVLLFIFMKLTWNKGIKLYTAEGI